MKINNSLTGKLEEFEPINPPEVNMYTCGVTVYDDCHIGHARSLYVFDVMRRYLEYKGFKVNFVRNITDIDDKIINRANELKVDWKELVKKYIDNYREDLKLLGIRTGMLDKDKEEPRATKSIDDIKKHIQVLIDKGYAYATNTGVYFSVRKFKDYGKLSGQSVDQMLVGVRKESDDTKEDSLDFALWKTSKPGEPSWPSPWGDGRPGWHIECSVMSTKYLKTDTLDIHAGGRDLVFPHHENEIAQSEAKSGTQFAKYWVHHGLLTINGQKMAKSLGNFITIKDFLKKNTSFVLKLFFISAHYHSPLDYNDEAVHIAKEHEKTCGIFFRRAKKYEEKNNAYKKELVYYKERFIKAMDDDFNTPVALSILLEMVSAGHKCFDKNDLETGVSISKMIEEMLKVFNLEDIKSIYQGMITSEEIVRSLGCLQSRYSKEFQIHNIPLVALDNTGDNLKNQEHLIESFIKLRNNARQEKKFELADAIRNDLYSINIVLEDTKEGTKWRIII